MQYNYAVKRHLKARSPKLLEIAQLKNNIAKGFWFNYTDFQQGLDGYWYCWFIDEKNDPMELAKELDDANKAR